MMVVKMEQGWDRARAATFAWTSTAFPMLTGTLVTAAGFLPVGFAKSSAGEYAGGIFWVVGLALIASWLVAVVFTPYLGLKLLPDFAKHGQHARIPTRSTTPASTARCAAPSSSRCAGARPSLPRRSLLFVAAVAGFGLVQQQFFPTSTRTELFFEMRLPEGTAIGVTDAAAKKAERLLAGDPDIATYTTYVGQGSPRFWLGLNPVLPNPNFAQIVIVTKDLAARERVKARLETRDRRRRAAGSARARRPLRVRPAGRLPGAVPRGRPRSDEGARDRRAGPRGHGGESARSSTRTSTGASRSSRSASRSTRTAPARWA